LSGYFLSLVIDVLFDIVMALSEKIDKN